MDQLVSTCVFRGAPASVYKGGRGGGAAGPMGGPGGVLLQPGVGLPPLALLEKEGGRIGLGGGGGAPLFPSAPLSSHLPFR